MKNGGRQISLGFTNQKFSPGVHICQIVNGDEEREDALLKFLLSGVQAGERTSCFSDKATEAIVSAYLDKHGAPFTQARESGMLSMAGTREVYFQNDRFEPDRMLEVLARYYDDSVAQGYPAARVIGEMSPEIEKIEGGGRLMEYEARVSVLLRDHPVTAVCQYDARNFSGATIMDILKVHPLMVVKGEVIHNPFFIKPEELLSH